MPRGAPRSALLRWQRLAQGWRLLGRRGCLRLVVQAGGCLRHCRPEKRPEAADHGRHRLAACAAPRSSGRLRWRLCLPWRRRCRKVSEVLVGDHGRRRRRERGWGRSPCSRRRQGRGQSLRSSCGLCAWPPRAQPVRLCLPGVPIYEHAVAGGTNGGVHRHDLQRRVQSVLASVDGRSCRLESPGRRCTWVGTSVLSCRT